MVCIGSTEKCNLPLYEFNHELRPMLKQVNPKPGKTSEKTGQGNDDK